MTALHPSRSAASATNPKPQVSERCQMAPFFFAAKRKELVFTNSLCAQKLSDISQLQGELILTALSESIG